MKSTIEEIFKQTKSNIYESVEHDKKRSTFLGTLLHASGNVHELHLLEKVYSKHVILDDLYKYLPELVDSLIEKDMATNGFLKKYINDNESLMSSNPIEYVENLRQFTFDMRKELYDDKKNSNIWSLIDDILDTYDECLYKLENLK